MFNCAQPRRTSGQMAAKHSLWESMESFDPGVAPGAVLLPEDTVISGDTCSCHDWRCSRPEILPHPNTAPDGPPQRATSPVSPVPRGFTGMQTGFSCSGCWTPGCQDVWLPCLESLRGPCSPALSACKTSHLLFTPELSFVLVYLYSTRFHKEPK